MVLGFNRHRLLLCIGAEDRSRTCNLSLTRRLLCQLSYISVYKGFLVPLIRLELIRYRYQWILSPPCLPFHHSGTIAEPIHALFSCSSAPLHYLQLGSRCGIWAREENQPRPSIMPIYWAFGTGTSAPRGCVRAAQRAVRYFPCICPIYWSEQQDSNLRPKHKSFALPDCAMFRKMLCRVVHGKDL